MTNFDMVVCSLHLLSWGVFSYWIPVHTEVAGVYMALSC